MKLDSIKVGEDYAILCWQGCKPSELRRATVLGVRVERQYEGIGRWPQSLTDTKGVHIEYADPSPYEKRKKTVVYFSKILKLWSEAEKDIHIEKMEAMSIADVMRTSVDFVDRLNRVYGISAVLTPHPRGSNVLPREKVVQITVGELEQIQKVQL